MGFGGKHKRVATVFGVRMAAGAVVAGLAVAIAVPATAAMARSRIELNIEGAAAVGGVVYVADRSTYTARVSVPADLEFDASKSTVCAKGVDGAETDAWEDKTPADTKEGDPRVYETTISQQEAVAGVEASIVVSKDGVEQPAEVVELPAVTVDFERPSIFIKMSRALAGQEASESDEGGAGRTVDLYAGKNLEAVITIEDETFDASTTKVNGAVLADDQWSSDGNKHTATVSCTSIEDLKVETSDKVGNSAFAEYGQPGVAFDADGSAAKGDAFKVCSAEPEMGAALVAAEESLGASSPYDLLSLPMSSAVSSIDVTWDNTDAKGVKDGKTYYSAARTATVAVDKASYDQGRVVIVAPGASSISWDDASKGCKVVFDEDGEQRLQVKEVNFFGGGTVLFDSGAFVVDTTAPKATVSYDLVDAENGKYFSSERAATIEVEEANFDTDLVSISADGDEGACEVSEWAHEGSKHTATVTFRNSDKPFNLKVEGTDLARRPIEFSNDGEDPVTSYASGEFIVDTVAPVVSVTLDKEPTNTYQGVEYYNDGVTVTVQVVDDHFDGVASSSGSAGAQSESEWMQDASDPHVWSKTVTYAEGTGRSLSVSAVDLAGNAPDPTTPGLSYGPFTIDMTAPQVTSASVSATPVNNYSTNYYFYNRDASVSIAFSDNISLETVSVVDAGDGYYSQDVLVASDAVIGNASATATLALADGHEFDRDVVVKASDLARNERYWSISPTGTARVLSEQEVENLSVFNPEKIYPEGLLKDTVAPRLSLSGVEEGQYYNAPQTVSLVVDELNVPYLRTYEPDQGVLTVTKQEGDASRSESSWSRPVSYLGVVAHEGLSFTDGNGATYTYDAFGMSETFSDDGHYVIDAQVTDPAKNRGTAHLAEFTVDRTAPTVQVDFDNNDVRNGKYYKAGRAATITVTEHNFDPSLINIETTGMVSGWSDDGDVHMATVTFATDGVYNLSVFGKDKAGNEMAPYKADEFVVDLTAPTVTITGVEDAHAYKDQVMPVISFADEANFDPAGTTYTLMGTKNGEVTYDVSVSEDSLGSKVAYADFVSEAAVDDIYTLTAHLIDLAGNEAEATLTFSVNRFGSTFRVVDADVYKKNNGYLTEHRAVTMEEINVSGVASEEHGVTVSQGLSTSELARTEGASATGYTIDEGTSDADDTRGWAVYRYNISAGNFSKDGRYHVSVHSNDLAENINTSSGYYDRSAGAESVAEVDFILDTTDPVITNLSVHDGDVIDSDEYEGTFKVVENIGISEVKVLIDGQETTAKGDAYGNYTFYVKKAAFTDRELKITATDLAGRTAETEVKGFHVTANILELHLAWVIAGALTAVVAIGGIIFALLKRKKEESER